jgi:nucleotide-binding universal stress UspA family protein
MTSSSSPALIAIAGYRIDAFLDAAAETLHPALPWLLLHVQDTRPVEEAERAMAGLPGRGPGHHHLHDRLLHTVETTEEEARARIEAWLTAHNRTADLLFRRGQPEQVILEVAQERQTSLVVLGGGLGLPGRYPGPGQYPLSPVARFIVDHALVDVLLLRRHVAEADRQ